MERVINVAVTGYFATGSSAVIDLLREYDGVKVVPDCGYLYEHEVFYYPGGLFDLCTLLTHGNTPQGSDIAINNFVKTMRRLNDYDYIWYGSFKKLFGDKVMRITEDFVNSISERRDGSTSFHYLRTRFSLFKAFLQLAAKIVYKRNITRYGIKYIQDGLPVYFSMPTDEELYAAARKFTSSYFDLFDSDNLEMKIYDHLIWPQQVDIQQKCFDDNFKIIIVNRDPRDVFLLSKYIICDPKKGSGKPHFGNDFIPFAQEWKRTTVKTITNPNAMQISFEDLIYHYDLTVKKIEDFLGLDNSKHKKKMLYLNPERSIENTQVFLTKEQWQQETSMAEELLGEYLYEFPYQRKPKQKLMFDSPSN